MPRWGAERRARPLNEVPGLGSSARGKGERTRAASLFDADPARAYRRSASLLLGEEFFGDAFWLGFSWRQQNSGAQPHRENGKTRHRQAWPTYAGRSLWHTKSLECFGGRRPGDPWIFAECSLVKIALGHSAWTTGSFVAKT